MREAKRKDEQKLESQIQTEIIQFLQDAGFYVIRTIATAEAGNPDLLSFRGGVCLALEVKRSESHKMTALQEFKCLRLRKAGVIVRCVASVEEVKKIIKNTFEPMEKHNRWRKAEKCRTEIDKKGFKED